MAVIEFIYSLRKRSGLGRSPRLVIMLFLLLSGKAFANSSSTLPNAGSMWQVLLSLGLVIAVIFLLAWLARKLPLNLMSNQGDLRVLHSVSLGGRERATWIECAGRRMLLGVSAGGVTLLGEMPVMEKADGQENAPSSSAKSQFRKQFDKSLDQNIGSNADD